MKGVRGLLIVLAAVAMVGCKVIPHGAVVADVDPKGWSAEEQVSLRFSATDTASLHTIRVVARREFDKLAEPMRLQVRVVAPDSAEVSGEVVLPVVGDRQGGSFEELKALWVEDAKLQEGTYTFTLTPTHEVEGVWNVGVEIGN